MMDPTQDDMVIALHSSGITDTGEDCGFEIAEATYWFASDYHGGQNSNLYAALSSNPFRPGPLASGPAEGLASMFYDTLVMEFAR